MACLFQRHFGLVVSLSSLNQGYHGHQIRNSNAIQLTKRAYKHAALKSFLTLNLLLGRPCIVLSLCLQVVDIKQLVVDHLGEVQTLVGQTRSDSSDVRLKYLDTHDVGFALLSELTQ